MRSGILKAESNPEPRCEGCDKAPNQGSAARTISAEAPKAVSATEPAVARLFALNVVKLAPVLHLPAKPVTISHSLLVVKIAIRARWTEDKNMRTSANANRWPDANHSRRREMEFGSYRRGGDMTREIFPIAPPFVSVRQFYFGSW
jgi:hypothetical protein